MSHRFQIDDKLKSEIDFYKRKAREREATKAKHNPDLNGEKRKLDEIKDNYEGTNDNSFVRDLNSSSNNDYPVNFAPG